MSNATVEFDGNHLFVDGDMFMRNTGSWGNTELALEHPHGRYAGVELFADGVCIAGPVAPGISADFWLNNIQGHINHSPANESLNGQHPLITIGYYKVGSW